MTIPTDNFCPECEEKLKNCECVEMNDKNCWWLVEGVIVEWHKGLYYIYNNHIHSRNDKNDGYALSIESLKGDLKPVGVPFDCIPEWAEKVFFVGSLSETTVHFEKGNINEAYKNYKHISICFPKCPEQWKGKTFKITDGLRELICIDEKV